MDKKYDGQGRCSFLSTKGRVSVLLFLLAALWCGEFLYAQNQETLTTFFNRSLAIDPALRKAVVGAKAIRLSDGQPLFSHQSQLQMVPASCMKVVTTGLAILTMDSAFCFETEVYLLGHLFEGVFQGDLLIRAGGDPTLGSGEFPETQPALFFAALRKALQEKGIHTLQGNLRIEASSLWDEPGIVSSWQWEDFGNAYGAPYRTLNWKDNALEVSFLPGTAPGMPVLIQTTAPALQEEFILNNVRTGAPQSERILNFFSFPEKAGYVAEGSIPARSFSYRAKAALTSPEKYLLFDLKEALRDFGLQKPDSPLSPEASPELLMRWKSPSLIRLAQKTNEKSINLFAESLFLQLGRYSSYGKTYAGARQVADSLLNSLVGEDSPGIRIEDGSGLSRKNHLSADFLCAFLEKIYHSPFRDVFWSVLPSGGSGNLSRFLRNSGLQKNLRAKSGSMRGVLNYCGYLQNSSGEWIAYALIINNFPGESAPIRTFHEKFVALLAQTQ